MQNSPSLTKRVLNSAVKRREEYGQMARAAASAKMSSRWRTWTTSSNHLCRLLPSSHRAKSEESLSVVWRDRDDRGCRKRRGDIGNEDNVSDDGRGRREDLEWDDRRKFLDIVGQNGTDRARAQIGMYQFASHPSSLPIHQLQPLQHMQPAAPFLYPLQPPSFGHPPSSHFPVPFPFPAPSSDYPFFTSSAFSHPPQ